ncbi:hypothetical protein EAH81_14935 [Flavobacterium pectinovorum]|jgi:hypothetical protein|uniref:Uncharacterized protein n=1 Tax=Flavobacterium pectinovorum TaxID=29533 RepID=A0A502ENV7_9FLAO|nr:hypothetical protein EAH81_14935 [Flavobacterium pectinovorum]
MILNLDSKTFQGRFRHEFTNFKVNTWQIKIRLKQSFGIWNFTIEIYFLVQKICIFIKNLTNGIELLGT